MNLYDGRRYLVRIKPRGLSRWSIKRFGSGWNLHVGRLLIVRYCY